MGTADGYRKHDPRRACDLCGVLWHKSDLTRIGPLRWACPDDKEGLTAEQISRHNASVRPLTIRPVKNAKAASQVPTYQQAEGEIFNLVLKYAPQQIFIAESGDFGANLDSLAGLDTTRTAGWMALYLGNLVIEDLRPRYWISQAKAKLLSLCDNMLSHQLGPTGGPGYSVALPTETWYGAITIAPSGIVINLDVPATGLCLMALLRAWQASGLTKYRDGARRAATFIRRAQCAGSFNAAWSTSNAAAARLPPGPTPEAIPFDTIAIANDVNAISYRYRPSGLVATWAQALLRSLDGDATYGDAAPVGNYALPTAATLTDSIAQTLAWWAGGATDSTGTTVIGFGTATPRAYYTAASGAFPAAPAWSLTDDGLGISSYHWAAGIRSLYEVGGYTAQVATLYSYLRGLTPNAANAVPATWGKERISKSNRGEYDPSLCLATSFANGTETTGAGYDWRTVGILAPIQSIRDQESLGVAKDTMSQKWRRNFRMRLTSGGLPASATGAFTTVENAQYFRVPDCVDDPRLLTQTGLSMQTSVGSSRPEWLTFLSRHYLDLQGAVIAADAYRYPPGHFPSERG